MKLPEKVQGVLSKLGKYKYALLVLLCGVALMLLPHGSTQTAQTPQSDAPSQSDELLQLEQTRLALASLLEQIDGVGSVRLLLSLSSGSERVVQTDTASSQSDGAYQTTATTVLAQSGNDRDPVVIKSYYPVFKGAVVVCEGADSAAVRLAVVQAVGSLTGLGSDKISVVKMKQQ